jgi:hypothetical protein
MCADRKYFGHSAGPQNMVAAVALALLAVAITPGQLFYLWLYRVFYLPSLAQPAPISSG